MKSWAFRTIRNGRVPRLCLSCNFRELPFWKRDETLSLCTLLNKKIEDPIRPICDLLDFELYLIERY